MEENNASFQREGEIAFPADNNTEDTGAESQPEKKTETDGTQSNEGGTNTQSQSKDTPFDEHPRWQQRESDWTTRFNEQERRHQEDLKTMREEFGTARKQNAEQTKIPAWFGGDQAQWDAYRADRDVELKQAADQAIERLKGEESTKDKAVKDATDFLHSEIAAIQGDKTLNPTGGKVDADKLFKIVYDNQLIDTQGRWNYKAGWKILNGQTAAQAPVKKPDTTEKKEVANASTSNSGGGNDNKPTIATSATFKKDRPW